MFPFMFLILYFYVKWWERNICIFESETDMYKYYSWLLVVLFVNNEGKTPGFKISEKEMRKLGNVLVIGHIGSIMSQLHWEM